MTLQEFFEETGGNYDEVMRRMRKEERVRKFAGMFLRDDSYRLLNEAMESGNCEDAFRAAHTLKGVCANLSFTRLLDSVSAVTEELRGGRDFDKARLYMSRLNADYALIENKIKELTSEAGA